MESCTAGSASAGELSLLPPDPWIAADGGDEAGRRGTGDDRRGSSEGMNVEVQDGELLVHRREADRAIQLSAAALSTDVLTRQSGSRRRIIQRSASAVSARPWPWRCAPGSTARRWR